MLSCLQQFRVLQIKVASVSVEASHMASAEVDNVTHLLAEISAGLVVKSR